MTAARICNVCNLQREHFKAGVVNGVFIPERCTNCFVALEQPRPANSAEYNLDREREDSARDILQPFLPGGAINPDFAHAYPVKAKRLFDPNELKEV